MRDKLGSSLSITGAKTYGIRSIRVSGNEDLFRSQNYELSTNSVNDTSLTLTGKLFPRTTLTATVTDNRWNPTESMYTLFYDGDRTQLALGDVTASVSGNRFLAFNKRLRGVTVTQKLGTASFTAIASRTKSAAQTSQIRGSNTPGPYHLGASQIVDGSERVRIDEQDVPRSDSSGRTNYILDTVLGTITFRDGMIIPESSTIYVSFETNSRYNAAGTVWGLRGSLPVSDKIGVGITYLTQTPEDSGASPLVKDTFFGGSLESRYYLRNNPVDPVVGGQLMVSVDGIPRVLGRDFIVNYEQAYIQFGGPLPATSTIEVTYTPYHASSVSVARSIVGFDTSYKPSDKLNLSYQFARSDVDSKGGPGGDAMALGASIKTEKLNLRAGFKNVDTGYAALESAGLDRTEKGMDFDARYKASDDLTFFTKFGKFTRPTYNNERFYTASLSEFGFNFRNGKWPEIDYIHSKFSSTASDGFSGTAPSYDSLAMRWNKGKMTLDSELRSDTYKNLFLSAENPTSVRSRTARLGMEFRPAQRFYLRTDFAGSRISDAVMGDANAVNAQVTANYQPTNSLFLTGSYRIANSGRPYADTMDGFGSTPNYGGRYNGGNTVILPNMSGGRSVTRALGVQFNPNSRIALDTNLSYTYAEGAAVSNTEHFNNDLGVTLMPFPYLTLTGRMSLQEMYYVNNYGWMSARIKFMDMRLGPLANFSLRMSYQDMQSSGESGFAATGSPQPYLYDFSSLIAELSHPIGHNRTAFIRHENSTNTGGFMGMVNDDDRKITAAGVDFAISKFLSLRADWRVIAGRGEGTLNRYKASVPNLELRAQF